jgi:hypothetical protein
MPVIPAMLEVWVEDHNLRLVPGKKHGILPEKELNPKRAGVMAHVRGPAFKPQYLK